MQGIHWDLFRRAVDSGTLLLKRVRRFMRGVLKVLSMPPSGSTSVPPGWKPKRIEGHYDIRKGAAGYAPIIGAFGALAVPAIIVLFTAPVPSVAHRDIDISMAAGLLIVAMVGSVISSIAMAGIGAEQDETANIPAEIMYEAVAVVISLASVLAAFEALAALYLPGIKTLFILITGFGGIIGIFFTTLVVADSFHTGPTDVDDHAIWRRTQWIQDRNHAERAAIAVTAIGSIPALVGIILRVFRVQVTPTAATANVVVGAGFLLTMAGIVLGALRSRHAVDGLQKGLRPHEALGTSLVISFYILMLMLFLP
jgi:hypothetical protein